MKDELKQIVNGCQKGDRTAQAQLYQRFSTKMMGICMRYAKNKEDAEDVLQEGFIKVFRDIHQLKTPEALIGWMRRVIVNTALQHIRKRKTRLFPEVEIDQIKEEYASEEDIFSQFAAKQLLNMVQKLPDGYRAIFNMYVIEGFSHQEIAEKLDISVNTSKSQLSRARAALRTKIETQLLIKSR